MGKRLSTCLVTIGFWILITSGGCSNDNAQEEEICEGYPDQASSPYILPWPVETSFEVLAGNCTTGNPIHSGNRRYAYDLGSHSD